MLARSYACRAAYRFRPAWARALRGPHRGHARHRRTVTGGTEVGTELVEDARVVRLLLGPGGRSIRRLVGGWLPSFVGPRSYLHIVTLADVTPAGVLAAVAEFDRLGRDEFLGSIGFGPARTYFLEHGGRLYDFKAVVGYAHGVNACTPLRKLSGSRSVSSAGRGATT